MIRRLLVVRLSYRGTLSFPKKLDLSIILMKYLNLACENTIVHDFAAEKTFCFIYDQTTVSRPMIIPWHFIISKKLIVHDFAAEMTFCFIYDQTTASRPMIIPWHFIVSKKLDLSIIVLKIDAVSQFSL